MVQRRILLVHGAPATVHAGGTGDAVLLLHGGWGGAAVHWSAVWTTLAERFHVVAPELPGFGSTPVQSLGALPDYVRWVVALLDAMGIDRAWCVGNSFGASLAWSLGAAHPDRCRGVVFVNGIFMPQTPTLLRWLGERALLRRLMRARLKATAYTEDAARRGFANPAAIPRELRDLVHAGTSPQLETMTDLLLRGGTSGAPATAPLLIFGENDRLPGSTPEEATQQQARIPGSRLVFIPRAGHLPQVENPEAFLATLVPFLAGAT